MMMMALRVRVAVGNASFLHAEFEAKKAACSYLRKAFCCVVIRNGPGVRTPEDLI